MEASLSFNNLRDEAMRREGGKKGVDVAQANEYQRHVLAILREAMEKPEGHSTVCKFLQTVSPS